MIRKIDEARLRAVREIAVALTVTSALTVAITFLTITGGQPRWESMALLVVFCCVATASAVTWSTVARLGKPSVLTIDSFRRPEDARPRRA